MNILPINNNGFCAKIGGDYSKVSKIAQNAGYPIKNILKINEKLNEIFPNKGDKVIFDYKYKEVFDGCCGTTEKLIKKVKLIRNNSEVASEDVLRFPSGDLFWIEQMSSKRRLGERAYDKYQKELKNLKDRRLLMEYFTAAKKLAEKA